TTASATLENARLGVALTDPNADGSGSFKINGVSISYNFKTDSLNSVLSRINSSSAGVTASYDSVNDRVLLTNNNTGDVGFSIQDVSGNLMAALKISSSTGTLQAGKNAAFSINDGGTLTSMSNTLDVSAHGIAGLTVTINSKTTETITVANDTTAVKSAIDDFIKDYNDAQGYIDTQTKITTASGKVTTATLSNNQEVSSWSRTLRSLAFGTLSGLSGSVKNLDGLGIGFSGTDSTLKILDTSKLTTALTTATTDVADFFTNSTSGFSKTMGAFLIKTVGDSAYGTKGTLDNQIAALTEANTHLDEQIADLERQLAERRQILESAFIAMDTAQSTSNNIMKQISAIGSIGSSK
ncbi:MAG: flagellar filament capping protein FliD, partial [Opitutaceae bacterium]